jgi:hypothetical protein
VTRLRIDDQVTYRGRLYVITGFEPMSVPSRRVDLVDLFSGAPIRVPLAEIEQPDRRRRHPATRRHGYSRPTIEA